MKKQYVIVEALVPSGVDVGAHPEHPIYLPVDPPVDAGLHPEHPIYFPVGIWGGANEPFPTPPIYLPVPPPDAGGDYHPEHPIYWPVYPAHPIVLPPNIDIDDDQKQKLLDFLFGHLPPFDPPDYVAPVTS